MITYVSFALIIYNANSVSAVFLSYLSHLILLIWTSREQTLRWWHLKSTWVFTWTINWTRLITLQLHLWKVRAVSICRGSSGPLASKGHSRPLSMTQCKWWERCNTKSRQDDGLTVIAAGDGVPPPAALGSSFSNRLIQLCVKER